MRVTVTVAETRVHNVTVTVPDDGSLASESDQGLWFRYEGDSALRRVIDAAVERHLSAVDRLTSGVRSGRRVTAVRHGVHVTRRSTS